MLDLDSNLFEEKIYDNEEKCLEILTKYFVKKQLDAATSMQ